MLESISSEKAAVIVMQALREFADDREQHAARWGGEWQAAWLLEQAQAARELYERVAVSGCICGGRGH